MLRRIASKRMPLVITGENFHIDDAIGISFSHKTKQFYAKCEITAYFGSHTAKLKKGYRWNGADTPRLFWTLLGVTPEDRRSIIASGFHDDGTERRDIPQVIADATFVSLLKPFRFNGASMKGVGPVRAMLMYAAVRLYSICVRPIRRAVFGK